MAVSITRVDPPGRRPPRAGRARRPFRDNPILILAGILLLLAALAATLTFANRSTSLAPDFLADFVLYALGLADLTMLVALVFVLARNIVKLFVERRRGLPFARFRAKLVIVLIGMTLLPTVLVLIVGSELIRTSVQRWFDPRLDEVVTSASRIAADYYRDRQRQAADRAKQLAATLEEANFADADLARLSQLVAPAVTEGRIARVDVYRIVSSPLARPEVASVFDVAAPTLPPGHSRASADRVAERAVGGNLEPLVEPISGGGDFIRAAALIRGRGGAPIGVVVASDLLSGDLAARSRHLTDVYEDYTQLQVLQRPLTGVYLSFFLMVTLMILVGAIWVGLYMAKRITRPIHALAAAAREIGAGHLDHRVEPETVDEFGSLVEAFNTMAGELAAGRRRLERSTLDLQRKHQEVEGRRRYIETILERIATGVVSIDPSGRVSTVNAAAGRLLGLDQSATGQVTDLVFSRPDLQPLKALLEGARLPGDEPKPLEVMLVREGRELHLAAVATALQGDTGTPEGMVLVLDDITPLIRAQKVAAWREVARRLAHEIKNPLTPIQLSAERLRRHFASQSGSSKALVDECSTTIVTEVESLKGLVDEFSQFARMPPPRRMPTDLPALLNATLALYNGLFQDVRISCAVAGEMPLVQVDPEQIRRVIINLVDNAIEAMDRRGAIGIEARHDPANAVIRITVSDDGPGIPAADREKLFLPYYSTKRRGSGLGLAIVRRIVAEHGGSIDVGDHEPRGTTFTIELAC